MPNTDIENDYLGDEGLTKLIGHIKKADIIIATALDRHVSDKNNPHEVTAGQVGAYSTSETDAVLAVHDSDPESHQDIRQAITDEATARDTADGEIITSLEDETTARRLNDELLEQQIADIAVQTDWDEDDSQSMAFLKNRPSAISTLEIDALFI